MSTPSYNRILVVRTDRIGDVVLSTPLIRSLRKTFPRASISVMVRPYAQEVLKENPNIDEILLDDPMHAHAGAQGMVSQVRMLRERRFDVALILLPKSRLTWMMFLAGIPLRVGEGMRLDHFLTCTRMVTRKGYAGDRHEADYCLDLGRRIGAVPDGLEAEIFVSVSEAERAEKWLQKAGVRPNSLLVGVHPVSAMSAPNWRIERYAELVKLLLDRPEVHLVVTGGESDEEAILALQSLNPSRIAAMHGRPLRELIGILSKLRLLVSPSTGPMHLAAGLKVPTVSMFCPLQACSPRRWGPTGNQSEVVLPDEGFCQHRCPGDPHVCRFEGGILPKDVFMAVERILGSTGRPIGLPV